MRVLAIVVFFLAALVASASAASFSCSDPSTFHCYPQPTVSGSWSANGGGSSVTGYMNNNQCANVIPLGNGSSRLFCCYVPCGVYYQDVAYATCTKDSQSSFTCN